MIRGTTPTFVFTIKSQTIDLTLANNVYVTIAQGAKVIEKEGEDLEVGQKTVSVWLTQEESFKLSEGTNAEVQINWTYIDPVDNESVRRAATKVKSIQISKQLLKRVIT